MHSLFNLKIAQKASRLVITSYAFRNTMRWSQYMQDDNFFCDIPVTNSYAGPLTRPRGQTLECAFCGKPCISLLRSGWNIAVRAT